MPAENRWGVSANFGRAQLKNSPKSYKVALTKLKSANFLLGGEAQMSPIGLRLCLKCSIIARSILREFIERRFCVFSAIYWFLPAFCLFPQLSWVRWCLGALIAGILRIKVCIVARFWSPVLKILFFSVIADWTTPFLNLERLDIDAQFRLSPVVISVKLKITIQLHVFFFAIADFQITVSDDICNLFCVTCAVARTGSAKNTIEVGLVTVSATRIIIGVSNK